MNDSSASHSEDLLDSWKDIAAYLKRDITTVQRWERRENMPVHRHVHDKRGSVYALRSELDLWLESRRHRLKEADRRMARLWGIEVRGVLFADHALVSGPRLVRMERQVFTDTGAGIRVRLAGDQAVEVLVGRDVRSGRTRGWIGVSREFGTLR